MNTAHVGYACTDCYILAHDSRYEHPLPHIDPYDINLTDWICTYGEPSIDGDCMEPGSDTDICPHCEGSGTGTGITVGGVCDLGDHRIDGYWDYHEYII